MLVPLEYWDPTELEEVNVLWLLRKAEANNYLSCPAVLLHAARTAARVSSAHRRPDQAQELNNHRFRLMNSIASFDPAAWAADLQNSSPYEDLVDRTHLASAHKAAMSIYVYRIMQSSAGSENLESLVKEIIFHLSCIPLSSALSKATPWPVFIAGAETLDQVSQSWVATRLSDLWTTIPWGYVRNALKILESRWKRREGNDRNSSSQDWTQGLSTLGYEWFIC
jgi:hypothetical protein